MYCYWDFTRENEGDGPTLEECDKASSVLLPIMDGRKQCPFEIVEIDYNSFKELKKYPYIEQVPDHVNTVLYSSTNYPPALALAWSDIRKLDLHETITKEEFSDILVKLLRKYLKNQPTDGFILTEFLSANFIAETFPGEFIWVIGYTPIIKMVHYVGYDSFVYSDHVSCFKLTEQQIKQLPVHEMKEYTLIDNINKKGVRFDLTDNTLDFEEISELIRTIRLQNVSKYLNKRK